MIKSLNEGLTDLECGAGCESELGKSFLDLSSATYFARVDRLVHD